MGIKPETSSTVVAYATIVPLRWSHTYFMYERKVTIQFKFKRKVNQSSVYLATCNNWMLLVSSLVQLNYFISLNTQNRKDLTSDSVKVSYYSEVTFSSKNFTFDFLLSSFQEQELYINLDYKGFLLLILYLVVIYLYL